MGEAATLPELPEGWEAIGSIYSLSAVVYGPTWQVALDRGGWTSLQIETASDNDAPDICIQGNDVRRVVRVYLDRIGTDDGPSSDELDRALDWCRAALGVEQ